jgi:hypothetical protein
VYQLPLGATLSLKVTETFASTATPDAPLAGVVLVTEGGSSPEWKPRPLKSSLTKPFHSTAGSKTSSVFVSPLSTAKAPLADGVHDEGALEQNDGVVAVEPAGAVRLVGLGKDRGARGALGEHEDVPRGDHAGQVDRQRDAALPLKHIWTE